MTPTTRAGKALLYGLDRLLPEKHEDAVERIAAIEAEARQQERERLAGLVEAFVTVDDADDEVDYPPNTLVCSHVEGECGFRAAVLSLLRETDPKEADRG